MQKNQHEAGNEVGTFQSDSKIRETVQCPTDKQSQLLKSELSRSRIKKKK